MARLQGSGISVVVNLQNNPSAAGMIITSHHFPVLRMECKHRATAAIEYYVSGLKGHFNCPLARFCEFLWHVKSLLSARLSWLRRWNPELAVGKDEGSSLREMRTQPSSGCAGIMAKFCLDLKTNIYMFINSSLDLHAWRLDFVDVIYWWPLNRCKHMSKLITSRSSMREREGERERWEREWERGRGRNANALKMITWAGAVNQEKL